MSPIRSPAEAARRRVAAIGADPRDDEDLRDRKALLVLISLLILPVSALWGVALPRARVAGRLGAVGLLRRHRRLDRRLLPDPGLRAAAAGRPGRDPLRADAVDDPARRIRGPGRRRRLLGDPRATRRARLHGRSGCSPLVRRLGRRLPRLGDRGCADRTGPATAARLVHEHDARAERRRRRHDRLHPARRVRAAAAGRARRPSGRSRPRPRACCSTSSPRPSPTGSRTTPSRSPTSSARPRSSSPMSSTSRPGPSGARPPRWSASSTTCSATSTRWRTGMGSRRSRRSAIATWSRRASRRRAPTTLRALALMALDMVAAMRSSDDVATSGSRSGSASTPGRSWRA